MENRDCSNTHTLTPMQKITLRFVVVGFLYYGLVVLEGMIMRVYEVSPIPGMSQRPIFCHTYSTSAGWNFWFNLFHCFWSISFPGSFFNE